MNSKRQASRMGSAMASMDELTSPSPPNLSYLNQFEALLAAELARPGTNLKLIESTPLSMLSSELIEREVIEKGLPLVIAEVTQGWSEEIDMETFSWTWLKANFGATKLIKSPRDTQSMEDIAGWCLRDYVEYLESFSESHDRILYGKDITCPPQWKEFFSRKLKDYFAYGESDLVSLLKPYSPLEQQPETLMVYVGLNNTFTPGHTDICGSIGHNVMVYSDPGAYAIWFVAKTSDREKCENLWRRFGADLNSDNCFLPIESLVQADFELFIIKQKLGDMVFVPPDSSHQVINKVGRSVKVAWNRMTPSLLIRSYREVLPRYRSIRKPELYRIKAMAYSAVKYWVGEISRGVFKNEYIRNLRLLIPLLEELIEEETVDSQILVRLHTTDFDPALLNDKVFHRRICNVCQTDIFNRCLGCLRCGHDMDFCLECVADGQHCAHVRELDFCEHIALVDLKADLAAAKESYSTLVKALNSTGNEVLLSSFNPSTQRSQATLAFTYLKRSAIPSKFQCHSCGELRELIFKHDCANLCDELFCSLCVSNMFNEEPLTVRRNKLWLCPLCRHSCSCSTCTKDSVKASKNFFKEEILHYPRLSTKNDPSISSPSNSTKTENEREFTPPNSKSSKSSSKSKTIGLRATQSVSEDSYSHSKSTSKKSTASSSKKISPRSSNNSISRSEFLNRKKRPNQETSSGDEDETEVNGGERLVKRLAAKFNDNNELNEAEMERQIAEMEAEDIELQRQQLLKELESKKKKRKRPVDENDTEFVAPGQKRKRTNSSSSVANPKPSQLKFSRPVWAKLQGYPWWPAAEVADLANVPAEIIAEKTPGKPYTIYFFNEKDAPLYNCHMDSKQLLPFFDYESTFMEEVATAFVSDFRDGLPHVYEDSTDLKHKPRLNTAVRLLKEKFAPTIEPELSPAKSQNNTTTDFDQPFFDNRMDIDVENGHHHHTHDDVDPHRSFGMLHDDMIDIHSHY